MDPLENFGEQQQSYEMLEEHRELLAREAAEVVREHPTAEPVGVIMEADASEAVGLRQLLEQQSGQRVDSLIGVMPRKMVVDILRANHPATLDWLGSSDGYGQTRKLPLVAITKNGVRLGCVDYRVS